MESLAALAGFACLLAVVALIGVGVWTVGRAMFGSPAVSAAERPRRRRESTCPGCRAPIDDRDWACPDCQLRLDGSLARELDRIRSAQAEIRSLAVRQELDEETADLVTSRLEAHIQSLRPAPEIETPRAPLPRAMPVAPQAAPAVEPIHDAPPPAYEAVEQPSAPQHGVLSAFLEERNILWGELVGGLLIVGCSIALVLTLWRDLQELPYSSFLLAVSITAALFGAGQYTLHHWKLASTSRGLLVIALLLAPLNLLLLANPEGSVEGWLDIVVKIGAILLFVWMVRAAGRDLIGVEVLPGPIDRRWLLCLAVVGAPATQALPLSGQFALTAWLPLLCQAFASFAVIGGLSWYRRRDERTSLTEPQAISLLLFLGLSLYALLAAWGWHFTRAEDRIRTLMGLALPLALAGVPVIEAGILLQRRVASAGLRAVGTGATLLGAVFLAIGLALAWPNPLWVMFIAALSGAILTRVAWREKLPWFQAAALPALGYALVLAVNGAAGAWSVPEGIAPGAHLQGLLTTSLSAFTLTAFGIVLALVAETAVRLGDRSQAVAYAWAGLGAAMLGLFLISVRGTEEPWPAVAVHAACGFGLLASNVRWRKRALAEAGGFILFVGSLWTLWAAIPNERDIWGVLVGMETLGLAVLALATTPLAARPGSANVLIRQYRSAASNLAVAAGLVAIVFTLTSSNFPSGRWHSATLLAIAISGLCLARVRAHSWPTWVASAAALLTLAHLFAFVFTVRPGAAALLLALLSHASLAILGSLAFRSKRSLTRLFKAPLHFSARISAFVAVPVLLLPSHGLSLEWAGLAVWLAAICFAMAWVWREVGTFAAMHATLAMAAILAGFAWVEQQEWWLTTSFRIGDPRAVQAFGCALAILGLATIIVRPVAARSSRLVELWLRNPLPVDRIILGAVVLGQLLVFALAIAPAVEAELIPLGHVVWRESRPELMHAFGSGAWLLLALLLACLVAALRLAEADDTEKDALIVGSFVLAAGGIVAGAGTFAPWLASASALRWGLAAYLLAGSTLLYFREPIARQTASLGFRVRGTRTATICAYTLLAVAAAIVVMLSANLASLGLQGFSPSGPLEGTLFFAMGWTVSNVIPLALVVVGLSVTAVRERASGYAFAAGTVLVATATGGYALSIVTGGGILDSVVQMRLAMIAIGTVAAWALLWRSVEHRVPGGPLLTLQSLAGLAGLGMVAIVPLARLAVNSPEVLPDFYREFGWYGWLVLGLAAWAAFLDAKRVAPEARSQVVGFTALVAGIVAACAVQPWDHSGQYVSFDSLLGFWALAGLGLTAGRVLRPRTFNAGWIVVLNLGLAMAAFLRDAPDMGRGVVPLLLTGYSLLASLIVVKLSRTQQGEAEADSRWNWLIAAHASIALAAIAFALRMSLVEPHLEARFTGPISVLMLTVAANFIRLRGVVFTLAAITLGLTGWAIPDPHSPTAWLERNGWAFTAFVVGTVVLFEVVPRSRRAGLGFAVAALGLLPIVILQQIPVFDPNVNRTSLELGEVLAILAGIAAMMALAIRLALRPAADPLELTASQRTGYVYLAEVLLVLFFVHVRLNLPELFPPQAGRYWTFLVMLFAFIGIGFAEWFERRGIRVLAEPLRRSGVLLPLIPLLAFWVKPPIGLLNWADGTAPGARPFLGYLEKLPQYFDNYAGLWLLAGTLYGLVALSRRSFGWAVLAALATNAGLWALLAHNDVSATVHPQVWVIPLALIVLVAEHLHRRELRPSLAAGLRYLGIGMLYLASSADMFIAGVGQSLWLPVILAVFCVAGIFLGIMMRVQAFLFLGVGFLLLDLFAMIWHAAVDRSQTWVWYVSGIVLGVAILALFAVFEKRRNDVLLLVERIRRWN